ncbi:sensor histidine kinase [Agromyces sp. SYSU K20354]|uniref:sensor histidine kinase n=1 Tax=Agromyces cavernae TaxID=2898659 RepID=UPI001E59D831|nr:sensor histidine kinase [Agromyces cavernae]MCD2443323.1 sensor histidine kinase [Agromyces cavernae]
MHNMRWWDAAVIGMALITGGILAIDPPYGMAEYGAWAAIGVFVVLYFAFARRVMRRPRAPHDLILAALLAVVLGVGLSFEPFLSFLQAIVYPMVWVASANLRRAIIGNVMVGAGVFAGYFAWTNFENPLLAGGVATLSVAFSLSLGLWITRIEQAGEERGRLLAELESMQDELAAMHRDAGVTSERERLAREIHDTLAQSLTGLVLLAQRASREIEPTDAATQTIALIEQTAREALGEARALVAANAAVPVESGLAVALVRLGERFARETGVHVETRVDSVRLDRDLEVVLLRCTQEALANVRKHAHATSARVDVIARDGEVELTVEDDGVGPAGADEESGFGVSGMRERLALVGGRLSLEPGAATGTVLRATVPVREREVDA